MIVYYEVKTMSEEKGWVLISRVGVAPVVENYIYKSRGRKYILSYSYYYDAQNKIHQFGEIRLDAPKKRYWFKDKVELNKFLAKRKIPYFL